MEAVPGLDGEARRTESRAVHLAVSLPELGLSPPQACLTDMTSFSQSIASCSVKKEIRIRRRDSELPKCPSGGLRYLFRIRQNYKAFRLDAGMSSQEMKISPLNLKVY